MLRDPRTLVFIFLMPILQLALLGYATNTDIKNVPTVVFNQDSGQASRALLDAFRTTGYFTFQYSALNQDDVNRLIGSGKAKVAIVIPPTYGSDLLAKKTAQVSVLIDGSDPTTAGAVLSAATLAGQMHGVTIRAQQMALLGAGGNVSSPVDVRTRVLYNPDLLSTYNIVPGLVAMILFMTTVNLTALSIVRERERGTIEQLIVTPIRNWELVLAKITPYIIVSFANTLLILAIGTFWFGVPIRGSFDAAPGPHRPVPASEFGARAPHLDGGKRVSPDNFFVCSVIALIPFLHIIIRHRQKDILTRPETKILGADQLGPYSLYIMSEIFDLYNFSPILMKVRFQLRRRTEAKSEKYTEMNNWVHSLLKEHCFLLLSALCKRHDKPRLNIGLQSIVNPEFFSNGCIFPRL